MKQWFGKLMTMAFVLFSLCLTVWAEEAQATGEENAKHRLTFFVESESRAYNGEKLEPSYDYADTVPGEGGLHSFDYVDKVEYSADGITDVGSTNIMVTKVVIRNFWTREDVTDTKYALTLTNGTLTVNQRPITIATTYDEEEVPEGVTEIKYDGKPHALDNIVVDEDQGKGLADGDKVTGVFVIGQPVTNVTNDVPYGINFVVIKNGSGTDVTSNYDLTFVTNKLTITQRYLHILPIRADNEYTRAYNGEGFLPDDWQHYSWGEHDKLAKGDTLVPAFKPAEGYSMLTNVGESVYLMDISGCVITNAAGETATQNYNIESEESETFTVEKADVTVKSKTAEHWYDGKPFSCPEFETYEGFAPGEGFAETNNWASQTDVGYCENLFDYILKGNTNPDNYNINESYGYLIVFERWRIKYDLAGGDFVTNDQQWQLEIAEEANASDFDVPVKLITGEAPVREGYDFLGWTNAITQAVYQPNDTAYFKLSSDVQFFELTALWQAKELPTVVPTTEWADKIMWYQPAGGTKVTKLSSDRDVTVADTTFKMIAASACKDPTNAMIVCVQIKAPTYISTEELAAKVKFNVDGTDVEQGAMSPIGYAYPKVLFHKSTSFEPESYYYIQWYAYVRPGEMNKALADNEEPGTAFGDTKLYCNWNNDSTFDTVYTIKFNADSCTLHRGKKMVFPLVQQLVWFKGYQPGDTRSEVTKESWDKVLQYEFYTNTVDLTTLDGVNDLVRTGYVQQAWDPEVTRGYAVLMKESTLGTNVVEMTAQWTTNEYDVVLETGKPGVEIAEEYEIPEDVTVEEMPIALPTAKQVISDKNIWGLNYWTNQFGKTVTDIDLESVGTNDVDEIPFGAVMTGIVYKITYNMTNDFANIDKPGTPYQSVNDNMTQYSAETNGGNVVTLKDPSCFGCAFAGWDRSEDGETWVSTSTFNPQAGKDYIFRARWTEYQAMVVEHKTNTTNYFTVVADAIKAVTNNHTTIAFLDAKGDGIQDPVEIKIPANLQNIAINFCTLSYTNTTGEAALNIGTNASVRVVNLPDFIGLEGKSTSRLVQKDGNCTVKVGEGATFMLSDKNIVLDIDDSSYYAAQKDFIDRNYQYYGAKAKISYNDFLLPFSTHQADTTGLVAFTNYIAQAGGAFSRQIIWSDEFSSEEPYEGVNYETTPNDPNPVIVVNRKVALTTLPENVIKNLALASNEWARVQQVFANAAVIYAPSNATLNLFAGNIGSTPAAIKHRAAAINWVGHKEFLYSPRLNFATCPRQDQAEGGLSQVAAIRIWTTNGVENAEFPYTIAPIGPTMRDLDETLTLYHYDSDGQWRADSPVALTDLCTVITNRYDAGADLFYFEGLKGFERGTREEPLTFKQAARLAASLKAFHYWTSQPGGTMVPLKDILYATGSGMSFIKGDLLLAGTDLDEAPTNAWQYAFVPTGVIGVNDGVVRTADAGMIEIEHEANTGVWKNVITNSADELIDMLVGIIEGDVTNVPPYDPQWDLSGAMTWPFLYDWDGAAGVTNGVVYALAMQPKDVRIVDAEGVVQFPYVGKLTYYAANPRTGVELINTNDLLKAYNIFDTITNRTGIALEPQIGETYVDPSDGVTYRFDGWFEDSQFTGDPVTNLVHETGAGQDVQDWKLWANYAKVVWYAISPDGKTTNECVSVQEAIDMLPNGGRIEFFGLPADAALMKPITAELAECGAIKPTYTIDLNGESFTNATSFQGEYLFEISGACTEVTIQNGTIGFEADAPTNGQAVPGGVRASDDAKVTLANTLTVKTDNTMVCADDGSLVTLDGAKLDNRGEEAGVTAYDEATLVFTNVVYQNTAYASNAEIRVYSSLLAPDIKGEIGKEITAIAAVDGAEVYLGENARVANEGDLQAILLGNAKLTVNDPTGNPVSPTISNEKGDAIFTTWGTDEADDTAEVDLIRGFIWANGSAVQVHAGKLTATNVTADVQAVRAVTRGVTILIDNDLHVLEAEDINLWNGQYQSVDGEALMSRNSKVGEKDDYLKLFADCSLETSVPEKKAKLADITKGAIFSSGVRRQYLAPGYRACEDDELIEEAGKFWHFIKTIPYKIDYDLNGGAWAAGAKTPITSYDVEMGMNGYQDYVYTNEPTRANYHFGGWTNATGTETQKVITVAVGTTGDLAFNAIWSENAYTVYVDYQGADGYPKYTRNYNPETGYYWWTPSNRYAYPNHWTGKDGGKEITPSEGVTFEAPSYKGFTFINFEDVSTGRKYNAGQEYSILDFTFDKDAKVHLRGVWASDMAIIDEDGNKYVTIEDALKAAREDSTLKVVGNGTVFTNNTTSTIVIDKNVTLDLNGKALAIPEGFTSDTLVMITNAPSAKVINGGLAGTTADVAIAPIKIVADEQPVKALESAWNLLFAVEIPAEYIKDGYRCEYDAAQEVWYIDSIENSLTFAAGDLGVRPDLTVTLNNEDRTFTCEGDPIALKDATRVGFNFLGWYDGSKLITSGTFDPKGVTTDVTLTAVWAPVVYTITYDAAGGTLEGEVKEYTCEGKDPITFPTPTYEGYTFKGWRLNGAAPVDPCTITPITMSDKTEPKLGPLTALAVWEANCYTLTFDTLGGKAISDLRYNETMVEQGYVAIPAAEKVGCKFIGWVDEKGNEVPVGPVTSCFSAKLTAVYERSLWTGDTSVIDGNLEGDGRGQYFTGNVTYSGCLTWTLTGEVVGKVTITAGKPNSKGLCTVTMTTGTIVGEGKTYTLKNTAVPVGEVQTVVLTGGTKTSPINAPIRISNNGVEGLFGEYTITASADRFAANVTKIPAATLAYLQGNWTLAFQAADRCHGATTLKLAVAAKGKVTITGNLGDGTAISTTSQLVYGDGTVVCPVVINAYAGKKGGFAFNLWFTATGAGDNLHDEIDVTDLSDLIDADGNVLCYAEDVIWTGTRVAETVTQPSYVFGTDLTDFDAPATASGYWPYELVIPDTTNVSFTADVSTGKFTLPKASTVKIDAATGDVTFTNPNKDGKVNDLGLALTYTPSTGALTGSMKVYFKAQNIKTGKWILKTVTAKVYGVMVGNFACCAAVEKSIGSAPANLVSGRLLDLRDCGAIVIGGQGAGVIMITTAIYGARAANGAMLIVTPWLAK